MNDFMVMDNLPTVPRYQRRCRTWEGSENSSFEKWRLLSAKCFCR